MDTSANITAAVFAAYLKCPTKAYLTAHGETPPDTFVGDTRGRISVAYKARVSQNPRTGLTGVVPIDFLRSATAPIEDAATVFVDCDTVSYARDQPRVSAARSSGQEI